MSRPTPTMVRMTEITADECRAHNVPCGSNSAHATWPGETYVSYRTIFLREDGMKARILALLGTVLAAAACSPAQNTYCATREQMARAEEDNRASQERIKPADLKRQYLERMTQVSQAETRLA